MNFKRVFTKVLVLGLDSVLPCVTSDDRLPNVVLHHVMRVMRVRSFFVHVAPCENAVGSGVGKKKLSPRDPFAIRASVLSAIACSSPTDIAQRLVSVRRNCVSLRNFKTVVKHGRSPEASSAADEYRTPRSSKVPSESFFFFYDDKTSSTDRADK